jgi:mevalonate kinase
VALAVAESVIARLLVPVPSPASLNEVTSAPVLVSMLLVAEMKCGLSASAAVAVITTAAAAEMTTKAMRRIVTPPS